MTASGYYASPWPSEDAGPARLQTPHLSYGFNLQKHEALTCTAKRTLLSTMTVLGDPGEVFLLTHSALRAHIGLATTAQVSLIDPITLETRLHSPRLPGGPMWPGGMAVHANGHLIVVYGQYAHQLNRQCELLRSYKLPVAEAYNSFVVLANGKVVTKNLSSTTPAKLTTLCPDTLQAVAPHIDVPQPSIARLSAQGNTVYVVGVQSVFRYHWDDASQGLRLDSDWRYDYLKDAPQSYGWDLVLDGEAAWFMDNGAHNYKLSMLGAGLNKFENRLHRVSLHHSACSQTWSISGLPGGAITNPPLIDRQRQIVVAFDSANRHLRAWQIKAHASEPHRVELQALWHHSNFGAASHLLLMADTGELCVNDYTRFKEDLVVLDIETGQEKSRTPTGGQMQGVVFPSLGWHRDIYWCSMDRLARIYPSAIKP